MLDKILSRYPACGEGDTPCLTERTDSIFYVRDNPISKRCYAHSDSDGVIHFTVENRLDKSVHFLAVDHCILWDSDPQKCDFILFDQTTLCFVEVKTASMRQRKAQRKKAKDQLLATIRQFREELPCKNEQLEAYVCVLSDVEGRPINRASLLDEVEEFDLVGATLYHQNHKTFV